MVDPIGTVPALDLLTQDQLDQLFDQQNGYMSKVDETFNLLDAMDNAVDASKPNNNANKNSNDPKSGDDPPSDKNSNNNEKPKHIRKHSRSASLLITDKKTLILDVDNTLIYVRHFMDEMRVNDIVKLGEKEARVKKLTYRLDLEFAEGGQMSTYDHIITSADEHIPQRSDWFPDEITKVALIHQADPTGCEIELLNEYEDVDKDNNNENNDNSNKSNDNDKNSDNKTDDNNNSNDKNNSDDSKENGNKKKLKAIEISFLKNSKELSQLEPMMNRPDHVEVDFMYGGYLVRIRPNLAKFLAHCNTMFDVILFTAADGSVYKGLLHQVHELLKQKLSEVKDQLKVADPPKLWSEVYFREDCDEKYDEHGLPYRHKNLSKLGRDLSTIVMVDDNPLSYRGYEPNAVRVAGFWGQSHPPDDELMKSLFPTLEVVSTHKDVRYHLSGLEAPSDNEDSDNENDKDGKNDAAGDNDGNGSEDEIELQRKHSRNSSAKFLDTLKKALDEDQLDENGNDDDDDDDDDDSLDDSQSSGKDLETAKTEHDKDGKADGLLPQPKQATRNKKQQMEEVQQTKSDEMTQEELDKMGTYVRGHSDSVRIRKDDNDANNTNNNDNTGDILDLFDDNNDNNKETNKDSTVAGHHSQRSSMASSVGGVVFYNVDDESMAGKPLKAKASGNHNREESELGASILQVSHQSRDSNILQFEPLQVGASSSSLNNASSSSLNTLNNINENVNENENETEDDNNDRKGGRRNSIEMTENDNNENTETRQTNRRDSVSGDQSQTQENENNTNNNTNNHVSQESAALNEKYGFVAVNNENENNNNNNEDRGNEEDTNSPDYVTSTNLANDDNMINNDHLNNDSHYPLSDSEDNGGGNSCLCFSLFSKKKKPNKYAKTAPMANQELR